MMMKFGKLIGVQPVHKSVMYSYNSIYEIEEENGFNKQNFELKNFKKINSNILIERHVYTTRADRIVISRNDKQDYRSVLRFFNTVKVPDRIDSERNSKMSLIITEPTRQDERGLVLTLKQDIRIFDSSNSSRLYKFKNIKLIINNKEAYLIYPNGMGRIYVKVL